LVYDLGGGTFDVSVIKIVNGEEFQVKAITGNNHLGGEDFDDLLVEHFASEFKRQHTLDLRGDARALRRLRNACERAKRILSTTTDASVQVECLFQGIDFCSTITRSRFEKLCDKLFQQTIQLVEQALNDSKCKIKDIDEVVMVGGSTRIPKVQEMMAAFFGQQKLNNTIHPDEAVAYGAAVHAAKLAKIECCQKTKLSDVVPFSFSSRVVTGECSKIINKNTTIPCECTRLFWPAKDYQKKARFTVHEGENEMASDNDFLGEFVLANIRCGRRKDIPIDVTFSLSAEGILTAKAKERGQDNTAEIKIDVKNARLNKNDVKELLNRTMEHAKIDEEANQKETAKNNLIDYIEKCKIRVADDYLSRTLSRIEILRIQEKCVEETQWLATKDWDKPDLETRLRELKKFVKSYVWLAPK
jgi:heat shock 70kDa protein 1/2/6/8